MNSYRNQKICLEEFNKFNDDDLRIRLSKEFQQKIFSELIDKFSAKELAKILNISRGMIYHYRNNRINSISLEMFNNIASTLRLDKKHLEDNIMEIYKNGDVIRKCLGLGLEIRKSQLRNFRAEIPKIHDIIDNNCLNLEKWFSYYRRLIDFGCREIKNVKIENERLMVTYTNYAKGKKELFTTLFPRKIEMDGDFQYFFGLWVGDKCGGGRMGVMNKDKIINLFTSYYLAKLYQKPIFVLYTHGDLMPNLDYGIDKVVRISTGKNGYAVSVHSINGILKSFFEYLENNLDYFLYLIPNKNIFFAGLFDAEGNVFLEDRCFRWSSKNDRNIRIFTKHLKELDLFKRFDGSNLVTNNKETFFSEIFPYLKHPKKINDTRLIMLKDGTLSTRFKNILEYIVNNPGKNAKEIAKALKMVKVYSQLKFLEYLELIIMKDYPHKMTITNKGVASLSHGGKDL